MVANRKPSGFSLKVRGDIIHCLFILFGGTLDFKRILYYLATGYNDDFQKNPVVCCE